MKMQEQAFVRLFITRISNPAQKVWYIFRQVDINLLLFNKYDGIYSGIVQGIEIFFNISRSRLRNRMHKIP